MGMRGLGVARVAMAATVALFAGTAAAADLKLMVEPTYGPTQAAEVYKPLIAYLNTATGHKFTLVTPRN